MYDAHHFRPPTPRPSSRPPLPAKTIYGTREIHSRSMTKLKPRPLQLLPGPWHRRLEPSQQKHAPTPLLHNAIGEPLMGAWNKRILDWSPEPGLRDDCRIRDYSSIEENASREVSSRNRTHHASRLSNYYSSNGRLNTLAWSRVTRSI